DELVSAFENYYKAQGLWGIPTKGQCDYSVDLNLDLSTVVPAVAGPKRPQDHINLPELGDTFRHLFTKPVADGGYGQNADKLGKRFDVHINNGHGGTHEHPMFSTDTRKDHMVEGTPQHVAEMITNRPTPNA